MFWGKEMDYLHRKIDGKWNLIILEQFGDFQTFLQRILGSKFGHLHLCNGFFVHEE